ncbi:protein PslJ [Pseudomonas aeruginosa]|nr:protein PslJ [Pseudomonas aeruginosa]
MPGTDLLGISNLWLNFMYKVGLGGMLLFIAVTWRWWREARPEKGPIRLTRDNAIWLGSTGGILAALVSGLFDHYFSFAVVMIGLFWLAGRDQPAGSPPAVPGTPAATAGGGLSQAQATARARGRGLRCSAPPSG